MGDNQAGTPPDWLFDWVDLAPEGRALDVGAGQGDLAAWLQRRGFQVDAVESSAEACRRLRQRAASIGFVVHEHDLARWTPPPSAYGLVLAAAVLHFIHPAQLAAVGNGLSQALVPSGLLMAEVLTTDDPSFDERRAAGEVEVAPATFELEDGSPIHYFLPGELRRLFPELDMLAYDESRRTASNQAGYRAGATFIGRRLADVQLAP